MVASLKFESVAGTATTDLGQVKIITLADNANNQYTLDITTNDLKVAYTPSGGNAKEYTVNGLAAALGKLLTIDGSTAGKSVLAEEVAKKPVVEAIFNAQDLTDPANPINVAETQMDITFAKFDGSNATEAGVTAMLGKLTGNNVVVKVPDLTTKVNVTGDNATEAGVTAMLGKLTDKVVKTSELSAKAADKAVVEAILDAKDNQKSILVEKLGVFLDAPKTPYGVQGNQAAKAFLAEKGLKPVPSEVANELIANPQSKKDLADEIAKSLDLQEDLAESLELQNGLKEKLIADQNFKTEIKTQVNAQDAGFQGVVIDVVSQPESKNTILDHIKADDSAVQDIVMGVIMSQEQLNFTTPWDF